MSLSPWQTTRLRHRVYTEGWEKLVPLMERKLLRLFLRLIKIFLKNKERVHIALAGGKTPMPFYRMLSLEYLPWERLYFYLTDERFVPLNSPKSNYKNIRENLGAKAKITYVNTELPLRDACLDYSQKLPQGLDVCLLPSFPTLHALP